METAGSTSRRQALAPALLLLAVAMTLRVGEYLRNKAIWLDEAHLALSILRRGYAGLLERLDYGQGAPLAFLWGERFAIDWLGTSEYALRAIPLVASLAACVLALVLFRRMLPRGEFYIAFAIFALSAPVIRYASEVKAYATDLLTAIVLLLLLLPLAQSRITPGRFVLIGLAGALSIWCAFPAIFVLAGVGGVLFIDAARRRAWPRTAALAGLLCIWAISFAADFLLLLRYNSGNAEVRGWWLDRFMPLPPTSASDVNWFVRTFFDLFADPLGLSAGGLGAFLFLLGVGALASRDRLRLALLLAPPGIALLASGLQQYPFVGRFLLFTVPVAAIVIGEGWRLLRQQVQHRGTLAVLGVLLFLQPAIAAAGALAKHAPEGVRPSFRYLADHWQDGDKLYVYHWAVAPFQYYEFKTGRDFPEIEGSTSRADWNYYKSEIAPLRGSARVWVMLTNTPKPLAGQEDKFILTCFDALGHRIDGQGSDESSVYLYDLSALDSHDR